MAFVEEFGIMVGAVLTIMIYSFLVKDNPLFRVAERLTVGLGIGYALTLGMKNVFRLCINPLMDGDILLIIPLILSLLQFTTFTKESKFLAKWPLAIILGTGTGLAMRGTMKAQIISQLLASAPSPFITGDMLSTFNNIVIAVIPMCILIYFLFSFGEGKVTKGVGRIGVFSMMVGFGASFGNYVLTRETILYGRVKFLLTQYPANYVTYAVVTAIIIYTVYYFLSPRARARVQ